MNETPNYCEIVIYNLAASTVAQVKAGQTVILEAGYEGGNFGMIFTGQIVQPFVDRENGVDTKLHLICQDGDQFLNSSFTAKTLEKGSTPMDVVNACATIAKDLIGQKVQSGGSYIRGKVMFGMSADYLKGIAQRTDTQFFVNDGKINIVGAEDYREGMAVALNADTGLIGDPSQTDDGVSAQCLINPSMKLNTLVHIDSSAITAKAMQNAESTLSSFPANGVYRIIKLTYEGDTHGDPWYCTFDAITQDGANPAGSTSTSAASTSSTQTVSSTQATPSTPSSTSSQQSVLVQMLQGSPWR